MQHTDPDLAARIMVLELTVAALVAQQRQETLEEIASLLTFVAGASEEVQTLLPGGASDDADQVGFWAEAMLRRVMTSRKVSRPKEWPPELHVGT